MSNQTISFLCIDFSGFTGASCFDVMPVSVEELCVLNIITLSRANLSEVLVHILDSKCELKNKGAFYAEPKNYGYPSLLAS